MICFKCGEEASHSSSKVFSGGLTKTWYYCKKHDIVLKK